MEKSALVERRLQTASGLLTFAYSMAVDVHKAVLSGAITLDDEGAILAAGWCRSLRVNGMLAQGDEFASFTSDKSSLVSDDIFRFDRHN